MTEDERALLQRRTLRVLTMGQLAGGAALASSITVGAFVIEQMLGQDTAWAGISTAAATTGTAVMAQLLAGVMRKRGRRPGLQIGYALATVGGVLSAIAVQHQWLPVFLVGLFLFGNGQAANLIARYTATDLALADERGRAMSRIVFASTFGAVLGPIAMIGPAEAAGQALGFQKYTGPWLFSAVFFACAGVNIALRLRPDPLIASGGTVHDERVPRLRLVAAVRLIRQFPTARLALLAMIVTQATMVAVMAMTSVHLKLHGHEGISQVVVSTHIAGMFALAPLVGRYLDREGPLASLRLGSAALIAGSSMAALSGDLVFLLFPSLWLIGLGWSFGLIGGSNLLIQSVPPSERVAVQGAADLMMSSCGGLAGFSSGFIHRAVGFHMLANLATVSVMALFLAVHGVMRTDRRRAVVEPAT